MAKIKDIAGGFFNNDTIYSPNGFTQARKVSDAIIDRTISDMSDEISQGMNFGALHKKKEGSKASVAELTGNKEKSVTEVSPLPSKKEIKAQEKNQNIEHKAGLEKSRDFASKRAETLEQEADSLEQEAKQTKDADERKELLEQAKLYRAEAERTRKDAETTYKSNTKKETVISPDSVSSGATAKPVNTAASGTKDDPTAVRGRRADEPDPKPNLPQARPGLYEDQSKAAQALADKRSERDEFTESAKQDKKNAKRALRDLSIIDDLDFEDNFDGTNPAIAALFKKGSINKLLKEQIKEKYLDKIAEITERIKNDPNNADLSGREVRKLINAEVNKFIEPLWREAGGDEKAITHKLSRDIAKKIKNVATGGKAHESTYRLYTDLRNIAQRNQHRPVREQMFLDAFDIAEKDKSNTETISKLKGEVKDARSNLTKINAEVRGHEDDVESARDEFYKGGVKITVTHKDGWDYYSKSGDGRAQYAGRTEERDGKKQYVMYSVTSGSPDTYYDPVYSKDYQGYRGETNLDEELAKEAIAGNKGQLVGGTKGQREAETAARNKQDFETLDGQNYFAYSKAHSVMAPKILKVILDLGGKIDAETGKIYSTSAADFPEGADQLYLDYSTAYKLVKGDDEKVAKLTNIPLQQVKDLKRSGMDRPFQLGDARVIEDDQGRLVYQLPSEDKTVLSGAGGRSFYINWNEPHNRKVVAEYAKRGLSKQSIPLSELKTVNTSRSTEGNIDWSDKKKTKAAEKAQMAQYTGSHKVSADILDALIGFGNKSKPL